MQLFLGGTPGTGEDDGTGRVAGAHGAEESRAKTRATCACVHRVNASAGGHLDRVTVG